MLTFLVDEDGNHLADELGNHLIVERTPTPAPPQSFGGMFLGSGRRPRRRSRPGFLAVSIVGQSDLDARLSGVCRLSAHVVGAGGISKAALTGIFRASASIEASSDIAGHLGRVLPLRAAMDGSADLEVTLGIDTVRADNEFWLVA